MRKPTFVTLTMLSLLIVLTVSSASAQTGHYFRITIPFEFTAGGKTFPAGEYVVKRVFSDAPEQLLISSVDGRNNQPIITHTTRQITVPKKSKLVFHSYGNRHFLSQIWRAGDSSGRELMKSKQERRIERELARNGTKPQTVAVFEPPN